MCNMHGRRFIVVDTMGIEIGHFVNYYLSTVASACIIIFSLLWPPRMYNNNCNPAQKTTSTDCASRFLAPQRVISYQNTKPRKQIGSLNCIPR